MCAGGGFEWVKNRAAGIYLLDPHRRRIPRNVLIPQTRTLKPRNMATQSTKKLRVDRLLFDGHGKERGAVRESSG